jgi:hypothetical protein
MPTVDFDKIEDAEGFTPIEPGTYLMKVDDVVEESSKEGHDIFRLSLKVWKPDHLFGRIVFDRITFSEKGKKRVKFVCSRLGLETSGEVNLEPKHLIGRSAFVDVEIGEYQGRKTNNVPWGGYHSVEKGQETVSEAEAEVEDSKIPF